LNIDKKEKKTARFADDIESGMESIFDRADGYTQEPGKKNALDLTGLSSDSMDRQAVEILRSWLSPRGENK
ncbi:MAG: hypothetical protein J5365_07485, partial [Erysipelotrichaceae bacterium]|nr:hypothetical protein [Erysipelotrichaceae bacterium]